HGKSESLPSVWDSSLALSGRCQTPIREMALVSSAIWFLPNQWARAMVWYAGVEDGSGTGGFFLQPQAIAPMVIRTKPASFQVIAAALLPQYLEFRKSKREWPVKNLLIRNIKLPAP